MRSMRGPLRRTAAVLAVAALAVLPTATLTGAGLSGATAASAVSQGRYTPPKIKHVWLIILENKSYEASFTGLNQNSYLWNTLPTYGALLRQYYGTGHFSQDNYLSMVSGQAPSPGPQADCPLYNPTGPLRQVADGQYEILQDTKKADGTYFDGSTQPGCVFPARVKTLFDQFDAAHVSWKGYMQDMGNDPSREQTTCGAPVGGVGAATPDPGSAEGPYASPASPQNPSKTIDDQYVPKHNPFPWFQSLTDDGTCAKRVVPLAKNLVHDLAKERTTPSFSWISPNNCSDAHDATCKGDNLSGGSDALTGEKRTPANTQGGLYAADLFLKQVIPAIMKSKAYQDGGLIDVTFDEGFPPYRSYGNSIADKDYQPDAGLGTITGAKNPALNGTSVEAQANTAQSVVACCGELPGPNTTQPGDQAFNQDTTPGGGIVGSVLLSPYITPGSVSDQPYNHYSWLRSMEDLFGVRHGGTDGHGHLAYAAADGLRPFGPDVYNNPKGRVLQPRPSGTGGLYTAVATLTRTERPISYASIGSGG
ncbi:alkaline phosphatase family protein [Amnibacterium endophyticum]|uniref:Alkaline phosphatase family protein n=1 Tax=Amnibacterium endophyticum TaxID=2109337 RepID=A0ABW4L935_9MICO